MLVWAGCISPYAWGCICMPPCHTSAGICGRLKRARPCRLVPSNPSSDSCCMVLSRPFSSTAGVLSWEAGPPGSRAGSGRRLGVEVASLGGWPGSEELLLLSWGMFAMPFQRGRPEARCCRGWKPPLCRKGIGADWLSVGYKPRPG